MSKWVDPWKAATNKGIETAKSMKAQLRRWGGYNNGSICGMCASPCPIDLNICPYPSETELPYSAVEANREAEKLNPKYAGTPFCEYPHRFCPHKPRAC